MTTNSRMEPSSTIVDALMAMGFERERCQYAAIMVKNQSTESALDWLFTNSASIPANLTEALVGLMPSRAPTISASSATVPSLFGGGLPTFGSSASSSSAPVMSVFGVPVSAFGSSLSSATASSAGALESFSDSIPKISPVYGPNPVLRESFLATPVPSPVTSSGYKLGSFDARGPAFTSSAVIASSADHGFVLASGVATDSSGRRLYVHDSGRCRLLCYALPGLSSEDQGFRSDAAALLEQMSLVQQSWQVPPSDDGATPEVPLFGSLPDLSASPFSTPTTSSDLIWAVELPSSSQLSGPIALHPDGSRLFFIDCAQQQVVVLSTTDGTQCDSIRLIPDGKGVAQEDEDSSANLSSALTSAPLQPYGIAVCESQVWVSDVSSNRLIGYQCKSAPSLLSSSSASSSSNPASTVYSPFLILDCSTIDLEQPRGLAIDSCTNRLFVADSGNHRVVIIDLNTLSRPKSADDLTAESPIVGIFPADSRFQMQSPQAIAIDSSLRMIYVCEAGGAQRVSVFSLDSHQLHGTLGGHELIDFSNSSCKLISMASTDIKNPKDAANEVLSPSSASSSSSSSASSSSAASSIDEPERLPEPLLLPIAVAVDPATSRVFVADYLDERIACYRSVVYNPWAARSFGLRCLSQARSLLGSGIRSSAQIIHAVELYRQALSHHVHEALGELSHLYLGGLHTGTEVVCQPTQQLEAVRLAKLGASLNSPIALSALGRCYLTFGMKGKLELESSLCDSNLVDSLHFQADFASAQAAFANAIELQQHLSAEESARSLQDPWPYYGQGLCLQATDHERAMLCFNQSISMGHTPSKTALQLLDDKLNPCAKFNIEAAKKQNSAFSFNDSNTICYFPSGDSGSICLSDRYLTQQGVFYPNGSQLSSFSTITWRFKCSQYETWVVGVVPLAAASKTPLPSSFNRYLWDTHGAVGFSTVSYMKLPRHNMHGRQVTVTLDSLKCEIRMQITGEPDLQTLPVPVDQFPAYLGICSFRSLNVALE